MYSMTEKSTVAIPMIQTSSSSLLTISFVRMECILMHMCAGNPLFGTLISLLHKGKPVLGIINVPILSERWVGASGQTTTLNGEICWKCWFLKTSCPCLWQCILLLLIINHLTKAAITIIRSHGSTHSLKGDPYQTVLKIDPMRLPAQSFFFANMPYRYICKLCSQCLLSE